MLDKQTANKMAFVTQLRKELSSKLTGEDTPRSFDMLDRNPEEKYYIGQLYPEQSSSERYATISHIAVDFNIAIDQVENTVIKISPQGCFYFRVFPTLEEQRTAVRIGLKNREEEQDILWRRDENLNYVIPTASVYEQFKLDDSMSFEVALADVYDDASAGGRIVFADEYDEILDKKIAKIYERKDIYRIVRNAIEMDHLKDEESFLNFIETQTDNIPMKPVWSLNFEIQAKKINDYTVKVSICMKNNTNVTEFDQSVDKSKKTSKNLKSFSNRLFNANLKIDVICGEIIPIQLNYFQSDYKHEAVQYAVGHNCSIEHADASIIQTTHLPCFIQKRLKTRDDMAVTFDSLIDAPVDTLKTVALMLRKELDVWQEDYENRIFANDKAKKQFSDELSSTLSEIERFEYGISILEKYELVCKSFVLANKSFVNCSKGYQSWRLFQIVFIVSLIPDIIVQEYGRNEILNNNLDSADVLFYPTGGGKTEAFLGVVVFALFFDRLRGKSAGVSAILKYPLRLLSAQQVSRVCDVLASAELLRLDIDEIKNMDSFSVGYFAGERNTPNALSSTLMDEIDGMPQDEVNSKYRLLDTCPFCGGEVFVKLNRSRVSLEHTCTNIACPNKGNIPIYIVDKEIYRYLPAVIISTLDKMAAIGYQSNFRNLLGAVFEKCPVHGFTSKRVCTEHELCEVDRSYFKAVELYDTAPGLIVCDEMHLSREALGTFASHYESVFQYMVREFSGNKNGKKGIKYIGASATISGYAEQMYHLFKKRSILFPTDSPYADKNLYSYTDNDEVNRILMGFMPYGKATLNALMYSILFMREILCNYKDNPKLVLAIPGIDLSSEAEAVDIIQDYWMELIYCNRKMDCNIVASALDDPVNLELLMEGLKTYEARKITGDDTFGTVKSLIQEIDGCEDMFSLFDMIISTSMISHGVDSNRFNNMMFFGIPQSVSEYVQAYSRTGRKFPSFVLSVMRPKNEKDSSALKHFENFHEYKNYMIDVVPIDRWADKAIVKTLPGVLSAFIINYYDISLQRRYGNVYMMDALQTAITQGAISKDELLCHVLGAYGCFDEKGDVLLVAKRFHRYIANRLEAFWEAMLTANFGKDYILTGFEQLNMPVMNSLRDTEESLQVALDQMR